MPAAASTIASNPVHCASCRGVIGWTTSQSPLRTEVACCQWCTDEPDVTPLQERNDEWRILVELGGMTPVAVARDYGLAHSRVYRTLAKISPPAP